MSARMEAVLRQADRLIEGAPVHHKPRSALRQTSSGHSLPASSRWQDATDDPLGGHDASRFDATHAMEHESLRAVGFDHRADAAVLMDGLERENALLRGQLERCYAGEKSAIRQADELRAQLEAVYLRSCESEGADRDRQLAREREAAARLRGAQGELEEQGRYLAALRQQLDESTREAEALAVELEALQHFVLPTLAATGCEPRPRDSAAAAPALRDALSRGRHGARQLRFACEARFQTLRFVQEELRGAFERSCGACPRCERRDGSRGSSPSRSDFGVAANHQAPHVSDDALQQAQAQVRSCEERLASAELRTEEAEAQRYGLHVELEGVRQDLLVREAEVSQLQLVGKYFSSHPQDLDTAAIAEEFRTRCQALTREVESLRAERDLLRAEFSTERASTLRWGGAPAAQMPGRFGQGCAPGHGVGADSHPAAPLDRERGRRPS